MCYFIYERSVFYNKKYRENLAMPENLSLELILSDEVRRLLDGFAAVMKIQAVIFSADGKVVKRGGNSDNCAYCRLMQQKYFGVERCRELDAKKRDICAASGRIICYHCHGGLDEMIAPIRILNKVAGFIVLGQFRTSGKLPPEAANDEEALRAFLQLPYFSTSEVSGIEDMLKLLIEYIVSKELVSYAGDMRYQRIISYFEAHLAEKITLDALARHLRISTSGLTHFLQKIHGTTFKQLLLRKRLDKAESLWRSDPEMTINEAAALVGYDDYHYFSRIYRKERGFPPGEFKKKMRRRENRQKNENSNSI